MKTHFIVLIIVSIFSVMNMVFAFFMPSVASVAIAIVSLIILGAILPIQSLFIRDENITEVESAPIPKLYVQKDLNNTEIAKLSKLIKEQSVKVKDEFF